LGFAVKWSSTILPLRTNGAPQLSTPHAEHLYSATSIVPGGEPSVYLVIDNLGRLGSVWREVDVEATDYETVIRDLLSGQYSDPVRIVSFNTGEGWSRDVSAEIVEDLQQRAREQGTSGQPDRIRPRDSQILLEIKRPEKITLGEMRAAGVRGLLIYCCRAGVIQP
jgi:hypothetical protein